MEWLGFRDAFSAIINDNASIPKIQKLRYLWSYLKDEAARIIDNLETTEDNYDVAWNLLKNRYSNQRLITQNHMQALFDLPAVVGESSVNLRILLDNALRHVRALTVLNQPTEKWDTPLIFLIVSKLDRETRKEWEKSMSNTEMSTFAQLSKFLRDRCQVLETITYTSDKTKPDQQSSKMTGKQTPTNKNLPSKTFLNTQMAMQCLICNDNHQVHQCTELKKMQVNERREIVRKKGLCFNCLRKNHFVGECKSGNCNTCNRRHHTSLHLETNSTQGNDKKQGENSRTVNNFHIHDASRVLLSTAIISVFDDEGGAHECRVLLDNGSQLNIISQDLVDRLGLKRKKSNLSVEVLNNMQTSCNEWVNMKIKSNTSNYATKLSFLILPQITGNVPAEPIDRKGLEIPKNIQLADPHFNQPLEVEALIGAKVFYDLLMVGRIKLSKPGVSIQNTRLGWVVTGKLGETWSQAKVKCYSTRNTLNANLEKFWNIEDAGEKLDLTKEETECERHFNEKKQDLGFSYEAARKRFFILERKLEKNAMLKKGYQEFLRIYELDHMEQTQSRPDEGYYLPHQAVIRESSLTSALRVVFDGSHKTTTGISLNDALMVGATIQDGVFQLVLRFRCHTIILTADIEKMYRQFRVHPQDRCYQKILWREDQSGPIKTYQLTTITYGTSAAPFLATRCLKQLAVDEASVSPKAAAVIESDFYVDGLMTGVETVEEAIKLKDDLVKVTSKAGLKLCKWISNDTKITENLSDAEKTVQLQLDPEKKKRTLGICWNSMEDTFTYDVNIDPRNDVITKRSILSQIAQLFDLLGLVAPVVLLAKIMLQDLWKLSLDWDDVVPAEVERSWKNYQSQLSMINNWKIDRAISSPQATNIQIHGFSDASMKAYGACLYLRVTTNEDCKTSLIFAKSRVAPVKTVSLPRLELCGAVLLAKLYKSVREALKLKIDAAKFWTDSMNVLGWIRSSAQRKEIFVANRITEIQQLTEAENWAYVPTKKNPADFVSKGQLPAEFVNNEMWKSGSEWLNSSKKAWPNYEPEVQNQEKENSMITLTIKTKEPSPIWNLYSSFTNLLRFVAYSLRFLNNARKLTRISGPLSTLELRQAWERIVKLVQREDFGDEINSLLKKKKFQINQK